MVTCLTLYLEWTPQEISAFKKAKEEKLNRMKAAEHPEAGAVAEVKETSMPETSIVKPTNDVNPSTSSWWIYFMFFSWT